ncbi:MAG TPA: serine hydrolase domain-containing protein [Anaerolineae bacterium]|nr:serine hydrolase domain-containing protein [Anaerolineae bacterium]
MTNPNIDHLLATATKIIQTYRNNYHFPSIAITLVHRDQTILNQAYGWQNKAKQIKATPDTVYRIASVSKTFAAIALMQLWEQGKFDLHEPVNNHLQAYKLATPAGAPEATFHHLLTHTAGLGEFTNPLKYLSPRAHFNVVRPHKQVPPLKSLYFNQLHAECPPGQKWCYANNGYATIGQLVADISGQPFPQYVRDHILNPLNMNHSDFWRSERVQENLAIGYQDWFRKNEFRPAPDLEQVTTAAGSMYATPTDMANYLKMLVGNGRYHHTTILQPQTLQLMSTPHFQLDPRLQGMGYGFKIEQWGDHKIIAHDGLWIDFVSYLYVAPDDELGIFVTTNCTKSQAGSLAYTLLRQAIGDTAHPPPLPDTTQAPPLPQQWNQLVGYYTPEPGFNTNFRFWTSHGGEVEIYTEEDQLKIRSPRGWPNGRQLKRASATDPLHYRLGHNNAIFQHPPNQEPRFLYQKLTLTRRPNHIPYQKRLLILALLATLTLITLLALTIYLIF